MNARTWGALLLGLVIAACSNGMENQPRYEPFEASTFFADGMASRPLVPNTVARGQLRADSHLYAGVVEGAPAEEFPFPITRDVLARGQTRYNIYCTPCHGYAGYGDGVIVERGLRQPPSFHTERMRAAPLGHYFDVITNGFGTMYSYADRITPEDRWAIVAYIQALQISQNATLDDVPPEAQDALESAGSEDSGEAEPTPDGAGAGEAENEE